jgi:hypothetical protein
VTPYNFNNQSISISTNNNNILMNSPTSPNQPQKYSANTNTSDTISEGLISPTSPNSLDDEILQRK